MTTLTSQTRVLASIDLPLEPLSIDVQAEHLSPNDLRDLMRAVTETTQQLQSTHLALQQQVARLQRELAEANAALGRSQALAALGEMAAGIAHEVRNPLGSIQLYVQMLADDLEDRPAQAELCAKIERAVVGLDSIVRDVLSFARNTTIHPESATGAMLLRRALSSCESILNGAGVSVEFECGSDHCLEVDVTLMNQALGNVMRNAIEAMVESHAPARRLRLSCARRPARLADGTQAERVILAVQDSGPGISPDVLERVFNPFFTTRKSGTGLGLAIVHRIVDAHGGHILIQNVKSAHHTRPTGTRVEIYLPVHSRLGRGGHQSSAESIRSSRTAGAGHSFERLSRSNEA